MSRLRSSCKEGKEGKEDERDKRKVRQDSTGQCGANDKTKYPKSNHVLSCVSRSAVLVRVYHPSLISSSMCRPMRVALQHRRGRCRARIICGWSWKEAIGRTTKEWTGLGPCCFWSLLRCPSFLQPSRIRIACAWQASYQSVPGLYSDSHGNQLEQPMLVSGKLLAEMYHAVYLHSCITALP